MTEPTLSQLRRLWAERDTRYTTRKNGTARAPLTENEIEVIRDFRKREVDALPAQQRAAAWRDLMAWIPPETKIR